MKTPEDLKIAIVGLAIVLLALAISGCGPQAALQDKAPYKGPPFVSAKWMNRIAQEHLDMTSLIPNGPAGRIKYTSRYPNVTCEVWALLYGDLTEGKISVQPDPNPRRECAWLLSLERYAILNASLTLSNIEGKRSFEWNPNE